MKKIALLFLTIDNHNKPNIWELFFKNSKSNYNIYCHPKYPDKTSDSFLKDNIIPRLSETKWGKLVLGYYELLNEAIKNKDNYKFVFVSNSCIPLKNSEYIYNELTKDDCTYIDSDNKMTKWDVENRFNKFKSQLNTFGINENNYIKHSGWFVLNRYHSELLIRKQEQFKFFNKIPAGDEHFLSILKANNMKLTNNTITYVEWNKEAYPNYMKFKTQLWKKYDSSSNTMDKKQILKLINSEKKKAMDISSHPITFKIITKDHLNDLDKNNYLFIRKIAKESDISSVINSIKSSL